MKRLVLIASSVCAGLSCLTPAPSAATVIEPVLYTGQAVPDGTDSTVAPYPFFYSFISPSGVVAVTAFSQTDVGDTGSFLMTYSHGQSQVLANSVSSTDSDGDTLSFSLWPSLSPDGRYVSVPVAAAAADRSSQTYNVYVWDRQGDLSAPFHTLQAPDVISRISVNNSGAYSAAVSHPDNTVSLYTGTASHSSLIAATGTPLPGVGPLASVYSAAITRTGSTLFTATADYGVSGGIYLASDSGIQRIIARNDPAPGIPNAWFSDVYTEASPSDDGRVVFSGSVVGPGVSAASDEGIWVGSSTDTLHALVREGSPAPHESRDFTGLNSATINAPGQVAFYANLGNANPYGPFPEGSIWVTDPANTTLTKLVETGDPAPGTPYDFNYIGPFTFGNSGLVAFQGGVSLPSGDEQYGLWIGTPGHLQLLLLDGASFDLDGDPFSIDSVYFVPFSSTAISDDGHVLAQIGYHHLGGETGQALVLLSVPEPSAPLLLLASAAGMARRGRRAKK